MRKLILSYCTRCGHKVTPYQSALAHDAPYDPYTAEELTTLVTEDVHPVRFYCPQCDERWSAHMAGFEHTGLLCQHCQEVMDMRADFCGLCGNRIGEPLKSIRGHSVHTISGRKLWKTLERVMHEVRDGRIYVVDRFLPGSFVLLPERLGQFILGLVDEEYGWPHPVNLAAITSLADVRPRWRRHPFVWVDQENGKPSLLAVAVSVNEFISIQEKIKYVSRSDMNKPFRFDSRQEE